MLCNKSHVYVDKVTKCCALNPTYMSPGLLKHICAVNHLLLDLIFGATPCQRPFLTEAREHTQQ